MVGFDMFELEDIKEKLTPSAARIIEDAIQQSRKRQHYYLGIEHIFISFANIETVFFHELLTEFNLDSKQILSFINEHLNITRQYVGVGLKVPPATRTLFKLAWEEARRWNRDVIDSIDLFIAIFVDTNSTPVKIFRSFGIEPESIVRAVNIKVRTIEDVEEELKKKFELPPNLRHFAVNLNKLAYYDKLPPIIGRENEMRQIMEILCHVERSNSVMIVGEPGVGKTAVIEGIARKIELEPYDIPKRLRNKHIVNLQMNSVVAGTIFRGMFEDRIEKIIKEVKEKRNLILFIDEAHTIIGAGSAMGVPADAANIFKATLARGEVQIIGATTYAEYKEYIADDEALARRFRIVHVDEPSAKDTRQIIYGLKGRLEKNYSVKINKCAIDTALDMSQRYMRNLHMPDKVIGWLDTACVKAEINRADRLVTDSDVIEVISQETKIPHDMIFRDTGLRFKNIEDVIAQRLVGQKEAVERVAKRIRLNKGPLKENYSRPDGVFLFLGPTGVGKTEFAKSLAEFLFGDENKMFRLDMSEYKDGAVAVDKLIGMPRGIVGSERGGILTNKVRENPYSVILLDEIEKANPYVLNLFLQVFDEGWLTDGRGKRVYFSDTIIIMTSNLGAEEFKQIAKPMGFLNDRSKIEDLKKGIMKEVENTFSPEFMNRIDDVIVFSPLTRDEVREITVRYIDNLKRHIATFHKSLFVTDPAIDKLADAGYNMKYGARFLKRHIDEKVKLPITLKWKDGDIFRVDAVGEDVAVSAADKLNKERKELYV